MSLVEYTEIPIQENQDPLVDLADFDFILEPRYFQQGLAKEPTMFLRREVALKLERIQNRLGKCRFKIWDAYRPRNVQKNIYEKRWKELQKEHSEWTEDRLKIEVGTFVSSPEDPKRIPPHATGGAVDLTLVDENGKEVDMGTGFDFFGLEAAPFYYEIFRSKESVRANRQLLREVMLAEGFTLDGEEWWHFDYGNQTWALKSGADFAVYGEL